MSDSGERIKIFKFCQGKTYILYSYGDSSGIKPDSHFNPFPKINRNGTNYAANVKVIK